jgi:hypothetical protein
MNKRTIPAWKCSKCGRTVAVKSRAVIVALKNCDLGIAGIATTCLRPHKCSHGSWCDECQERKHR